MHWNGQGKGRLAASEGFVAVGLLRRPGNEAGEPGPWRHLHRIRDPYRHEKDLASTLLHWGETRTLDVEDENGEDAQGRVEVVLVYKRTPYYRNAETGLAMHLADVEDPFQDSDVVHRVTIEP